jgi:hypothetical protein
MDAGGANPGCLERPSERPVNRQFLVVIAQAQDAAIALRDLGPLPRCIQVMQSHDASPGNARSAAEQQSSRLRFPRQHFFFAAGLEHSNAHLADSHRSAQSFGLRAEGRMS